VIRKWLLVQTAKAALDCTGVAFCEMLDRTNALSTILFS
jgi:hypothetical protein